MDLQHAVDEILLGASMRQIAIAYRAQLIADFGFRDDEIEPQTFAAETSAFMKRLARHLGDKHAGNAQIGNALRDWIEQVDHYEAWDALLSGFDVQGRAGLLKRGRVMFPRMLTSHWSDD